MKAMFAGWRIIGRRREAQDVGDIPGGGGLGDAAVFMRWRGSSKFSIRFGHDAAARKTGIEPRQIGQADAGAAEANGQPGVGVFWQNQTDPGVAQAGEKMRRADFVEQLRRRQVERHLQRLPRRDRAMKLPVEIIRLPRPIARGEIVEHGFGMGDSVAEGHGVDEGF